MLVPLSIITVHLAAEYCFSIRKGRLVPDGIAENTVLLARKFGSRQLFVKLKDKNDFVSKAVKAAANSIFLPNGDTQTKDIVCEDIQEQALKMMRKVEWLNIAGNAAPMIGLFGTVLGMIKLFNGIVIEGGQPRPDQMAEGISVALVTTFWGLFVAIPALAVHGIFKNRIEAFASEAVKQALKICANIRQIRQSEIKMASRNCSMSKIEQRSLMQK